MTIPLECSADLLFQSSTDLRLAFEDTFYEV